MCASAETAAPDDFGPSAQKRKNRALEREEIERWEESRRDGDRRFLLFLLLCPVAGPVAAFGHNPACRGYRAFGAGRDRRTRFGARGSRFRLHRGCRPGAVAAA